MFNERASNRIALSLFASQSLFSASMIAIFTVTAILAVDLSGSKSTAGIPATLTTLARAATALPLGILMDHIGRRWGIGMSYALGAVGAAVGAVAVIQQSFPLLLLGSFLFGMARGGAEQSRFVAAEVYPESRRATIIGWIVFAGTIGSVGGPALVAPAGHLAEALGYVPRTGVWLLSIVTMSLAALLSFAFMRPDPQELSRRVKQYERDSGLILLDEPPARSLAVIFRDPMIQLALASMLVSQMVMVCLMTIMPVHMDGHHYGDAPISIVIMGHTLGMFAISPLTGRLIDRYGRINMILAGAVILVISVVIAPLSSAFWVLMTSMFLLGLGWNFCFIGGSSLLTDSLTTDERGRAQGMNETLVALAAGLGSLSSGYLFGAGGFLVVSVAGLLPTLILTGMVGALTPRSSAQPALES